MTYQEIENKVISILGGYGAQKIGIFGSYARGAQRPDSDLDLLVNFKERKSLLTLVRIERELSESIGVKVDLLTEQSVSPYLIDRIKSELKVIYQ
jgi:predicted nucleotidyltransferase